MLRSAKKKIYAVQVMGEDFWEPVTLTIEGHTVPMTAHSLGEAQALATECHKQHPTIRFRIVHYYVSGYSEERATYSSCPGLYGAEDSEATAGHDGPVAAGSVLPGRDMV